MFSLESCFNHQFPVNQGFISLEQGAGYHVYYKPIPQTHTYIQLNVVTAPKKRTNAKTKYQFRIDLYYLRADDYQWVIDNGKSPSTLYMRWGDEQKMKHILYAMTDFRSYPQLGSILDLAEEKAKDYMIIRGKWLKLS